MMLDLTGHADVEVLDASTGDVVARATTSECNLCPLRAGSTVPCVPRACAWC
jgi:hypothetical protein